MNRFLNPKPTFIQLQLVVFVLLHQNCITTFIIRLTILSTFSYIETYKKTHQGLTLLWAFLFTDYKALIICNCVSSSSWIYLAVVTIVLCPRSSPIFFVLKPKEASLVAAVCRQTWNTKVPSLGAILRLARSQTL